MASAAKVSAPSETAGSSADDEQRQFASGTVVWISCPSQVWREAEVLSVTNGVVSARVEESGEVVEVKKGDSIHLRNKEFYDASGMGGLDDLTQLTHLHEAALLHSLNVRFDVDKIYTFTGPVLIAVNPFKTIRGLYDQETLLKFLKSNPSATGASRVPHVFASANVAYKGLCASELCQTILISGESGAGKTESTKFVMQLLALAGSKDWNNRSTVEDQVLQSNPLLEAFGNARTLRNDNSSRFGKFIEMQFELGKPTDEELLRLEDPTAEPAPGGRGNTAIDKIGRLAGAKIQTYLLETVRVCHQLEGERNYHMFYQLCAAAASCEEDDQYKFPQKIKGGKPCTFDMTKFASFENFRFLTKSSCSTLQRVDDVEEFENTILAMQTIGISKADQESIMNVVAAVLYIGNIDFHQPAGNSEASEVSPSSLPSFNLACHLLGIDEETLTGALCYRTIKTRFESIKKPLKVPEAEDTRDALGRALYHSLFHDIVRETNQSIGHRDDVKLFCGVLDIFGFECFQVNSFEQLCINFTNERLQQFFNTYIFKCEEELYAKEKIWWDKLDFPDNQDCVDLLQAKSFGVFSMLDEECIVPGGSDRGFVNKLKTRYKGHTRFGELKTKPTWFAVNHFAGPVEYASEGFLDKNRDQLSLDAQEAVLNCQNAFAQRLFSAFLSRSNENSATQAAAKKKGPVTVSGEFKSQLAYLMDTVQETEPHFIRCVKPNPRNRSDEFHRPSVTEQLRYGGVLQAIQVSRAGYPIRVSHLDCCLDYIILAPRNMRPDLLKLEPKARAQALLTFLETSVPLKKPKHSKQGWAVGETLVFLKHECYESLSTARADLRDMMAIRIQAKWKGVRQATYYQWLRRCTILIQSVVRGNLARREAKKRREDRAAIKLQTFMKMVVARKNFLRIRQTVLFIQSCARSYFARLEAKDLRENLAATQIIATWKMHKAKTHYAKLRDSTIRIQMWWRVVQAKRQLKKLRAEQKEASFLLEQKNALQRDLQAIKKTVTERDAQILKLTAERDSFATQVCSLETELSDAKSSLEESVQIVKSQQQEIRDAIEAQKFGGASSSSPHQPPFLVTTHQQQLFQPPLLVTTTAGSTSSDSEFPLLSGGHVSPLSARTSGSPVPKERPSSIPEESEVIPNGQLPPPAEALSASSPPVAAAPSIAIAGSSVTTADVPQAAQQLGESSVVTPGGQTPITFADHTPDAGAASSTTSTAVEQTLTSDIKRGGSRAGSFSRETPLSRRASELSRRSTNRFDRTVRSKTKPLSEDLADFTAQLQRDFEEERLRTTNLLSQKDAEISETRTAFETTSAELTDLQEKHELLCKQYEVLLKNEAIRGQQYAAMGGGASDENSLNYVAPTQHTPYTTQLQGSPEFKKVVDVMLVGAEKVGKTKLLAEILRQFGDARNLAKLESDQNQPEPNAFYNYRVDYKGQGLRVLDCPGSRAMDTVLRDWSRKAHWVVIVFNLASESSFRTALQLMKLFGQDAQKLLYGNTHDVVKGLKKAQVDMGEARDLTARQLTNCMEGNSLEDVLDPVSAAVAGTLQKCQKLAAERPERSNSILRGGSALAHSSGGSSSTATAAGGGGVSTGFSHFMNRIGSFFVIGSETTTSNKKSGDGASSVEGGAAGQVASRGRENGILAPSLRLPPSAAGSPKERLQVVQEVKSSDCAITCIVFGQERFHRDYVLFASGSKDGAARVYRCYRTQTERAMFDSAVSRDSDSRPATAVEGGGEDSASTTVDFDQIVQHVELLGHNRAVTSICFSILEDQVVTTSIDNSVRFWNAEDGALTKVFTDTSRTLAAVFIPLNPNVFIAANSNAVLRLVDTYNGVVSQKLKVESEVRALKFDDSGLYCLAGTKNGLLHVLENVDSQSVRFKFKFPLSKKAITSIAFVASDSSEAMNFVIVNSCDSTVSILDCKYETAGVLSHFTVRQRLKVPHTLLPLRSCFSPSGGGWLVSGAEDNKVYCYALGRGTNYRCIRLEHHQSAVVAVALSTQGTLLASADSHGVVAFWRQPAAAHENHLLEGLSSAGASRQQSSTQQQLPAALGRIPEGLANEIAEAAAA